MVTHRFRLECLGLQVGGGERREGKVSAAMWVPPSSFIHIEPSPCDSHMYVYILLFQYRVKGKVIKEKQLLS